MTRKCFILLHKNINSFYVIKLLDWLHCQSGCEIIRESCDLLPVSEPRSENEEFRHRRGNNDKSNSNNNSKIGIKHAGDDILNVLHALSLVLRLLPACNWV